MGVQGHFSAFFYILFISVLSRQGLCRGRQKTGGLHEDILLAYDLDLPLYIAFYVLCHSYLSISNWVIFYIFLLILPIRRGELAVDLQHQNELAEPWLNIEIFFLNL